MNVNQHEFNPTLSEKMSFWSRAFAGALVTFVLLVVLGRLSEAVLLSYESRAPQLLFQVMRFTGAAALFVGGLTSTRLAARGAAHSFLSGAVVWAVTAIILLELAVGGIEIYGSATMFGEAAYDGDLPMTDYAASWWSLLGITVSILACMVGAVAGACFDSSEVRPKSSKKRRRWQENRVSIWRIPLQSEEHAQALH